MLDFSMLDFFGISISNESKIVVKNEDNLPRISFVKSDGIIRIYFNSPAGQQCFDIDPNEFLYAYRLAKRSNENFVSLLENVTRKNKYRVFILQYFCISPSLILSLANKRYKRNKVRKIPLKPNALHILKDANLGWDRLKKDTSRQQLQIRIEDPEEIQRCVTNMSNAIAQAAKNHNLMFFFDYLEAFNDLQVAKGKPIASNRVVDKLQTKFAQEVNSLQKKLLT